jgi:hypothetical protein
VTIGIDLHVNSSQVRHGRQEVEFLNKALRETEKLGDKGPVRVPGGLPGTSPGRLKETAEDLRRIKLLTDTGQAQGSGLLKEITADLQRIKRLADTGQRHGGLLKREQFAEAEKLSKKIRGNFDAYGKGLGKARQELTRLIQEKQRLLSVGESGKFESPADYIRRQGRLREIDARLPDAERRAASSRKNIGRASDLARQSREQDERLAGMGVDNGMGPLMGYGKRAMGFGLALMGGMAMLGFLKNSISEETMYAYGESDLQRRGAVNMRPFATTHGFTPMEHMQVADTLNRGTGFGGVKLLAATETAKAFARGQGLSGDVVSGYMGGIQQGTGLSAQLYVKHMERLRDAFVKADVGGRNAEFLQLNRQLVNQLAAGAGGRALSSSQLEWLTGLQATMWSQPGMLGKGESGANLLSTLDQCIRAGGRTPGEQLFFWQAFGGDKIKTAADYYEFEKRKEAGLSDPRNLRDSYNLAVRKYGVGRDGKLSELGRMALTKLFPKMKLSQADMLADLGARGMLNQAAVKKILQAEGSVYGDAKEADKLRGNEYRASEAAEKKAKLKVGEGLAPPISKVKKGVWESVSGGIDAEVEAARRKAKLSPWDLVWHGDAYEPGGVRSGSAEPTTQHHPMPAGEKTAPNPWETVRPGVDYKPRETRSGAAAPETQHHPMPAADDLADRIGDRVGQRVEEALRQAQDSVQPVEVVNLPAPGGDLGNGSKD